MGVLLQLLFAAVFGAWILSSSLTNVRRKGYDAPVKYKAIAVAVMFPMNTAAIYYAIELIDWIYKTDYMINLLS